MDLFGVCFDEVPVIDHAKPWSGRYRHRAVLVDAVDLIGIIAGVDREHRVGTIRSELRHFIEIRIANGAHHVPMGRPGTPDDIASAVVFLAKSDYITAQNLRVDGGWVMS